MSKYSELIEKAVAMLDEDDELFCNLVDELDSWDGFADGYRAWDMSELDEFYHDVPVSKFLDDLTRDFCSGDSWFFFSIYGLESTDNKALLYRDNTDSGEVLDHVLEDRAHIWIGDSEFSELLDEIEEAREAA